MSGNTTAAAAAAGEAGMTMTPNYNRTVDKILGGDLASVAFAAAANTSSLRTGTGNGTGGSGTGSGREISRLG